VPALLMPRKRWVISHPRHMIQQNLTSSVTVYIRKCKQDALAAWSWSLDRRAVAAAGAAGWLAAAAHSMQARRGVRGQAAGRNQQPAAPPAIAIGAMPLPLEAAITMMAGLAH
jgi:hypothetical protein